MIYRPIETQFLWDTWLFPWKELYHLFFLEAQDTKDFDHVGHAISKDLVHWETLPSFRTRYNHPGHWDNEPTLTGMVLHHNDQFYMFVGAYKYQDREVIGVYVSEDLENWQPHPQNPILPPAAPYLTDPAKGPLKYVDWRDPCIFWRKEDQLYHAFLCARMPGWNHENTGAAVAHVCSKDLIHWEYLDPVANPGHYYNTEVPDIFEMNGRYYLLFSTGSIGGLDINTPSRNVTKGTFYMVGPTYTGPFSIPKDPLLIGAGYRRMEPYVGRTIPYEEGRLLYHHVNADRPSWGCPKKIQTHSDGRIWLEYLPILEKLETRTVCASIVGMSTYDQQDQGCWDCNDSRITGIAKVVGSSYQLVKDMADLHVEFEVSSPSAMQVGIVMRANKRQKAATVMLDYENQQVLIGSVSDYSTVTGWNVAIHDTCHYLLEGDRSYHLRCFARNEFFEVYLDDRWIFSSVMKDTPKMGNVEFYVSRGEAEFTNLRLAEMEPLA